jgi:hydroxyethylthiazole kinase
MSLDKKVDQQALLQEAARIVDAVREKSPLVHCITNHVTVNDCANILLSFGASPAMIDSPDESYDFARISGALYINFGTFFKEQELGAIQASLGAKQAGRPIVIDPVGCGAIPGRVDMLAHLHRVAGISLIKGNMGEIMALAGINAGSKGVDSDGDIEGIEEVAASLAKTYHCVVAATGKADVVTDGSCTVRLHNGVDLLTKITGAGCMVGALCGATAAVTASAVTAAPIYGQFAAAVAAITAMSVAGELAAEKAALPGSFRIALIDAIYTLTGKTIFERGHIA